MSTSTFLLEHIYYGKKSPIPILTECIEAKFCSQKCLSCDTHNLKLVLVTYYLNGPLWNKGFHRYLKPSLFKFRLTKQGGNSQNFLGKFVRFFVNLRCFYRVVNNRKWVFYDLYSS